MKSNNIRKTLLFLTGLFILLSVFSYLLLPFNSMDDGFYKKMNGISRAPENTIDYVTIGDSECSVSISPMEIWNAYGYAGYNCGIPGQGLQDTYYLLEQLIRNQSPKVVLLETNAIYRDFKYMNALENTAEDTAKKIFPVYKYHNSWKYFHFYMLKNLGKKTKQEPVTVYNGYQYSIIVKPYKNGPYVGHTEETYQIGEQPLYYLNKITDLCKENNIQLIFYSAPSPLCWSYSKHNAAGAFAEKNQLAYIDLNLNADALGIDWSKDTRDGGDHLNYYGSKKVSSYMGAYLSSHTDLTDRRKEKQYASWNEELKNYLALTGKE